MLYEKSEEIADRVGLIQAYQQEDFEKIRDMNERLFGAMHPKLLQTATKKVLENPPLNPDRQEKILGRILTLDEVIEKTQLYMEEREIPHIPIHVSQTTFSRMAVAYKKDETKINIAQDGVIREKELQPLLDHEIGTHLRRYLMGKEKGLYLFKYGTGYYLSDEEGLAIYNSFHSLPDGYEKNAMYINYYLLAQADTLTFSQTTALIHSLFPHKSPKKIFAQAVRIKRGITHTDQADQGGTVYKKDKIYLDGYTHIKEWIDEGGDPSLLYF